MMLSPVEPKTTLELHLTGKTYPVVLRLKPEVANGYIDLFILRIIVDRVTVEEVDE